MAFFFIEEGGGEGRAGTSPATHSVRLAAEGKEKLNSTASLSLGWKMVSLLDGWFLVAGW